MADNPRRVPVIGLVGGVGSGKSFLAAALHDKYNVQIVEGDAAGHQALTEETIKEQIRGRFGGSVFDAQGAVDRRKMSQLVFGSGPDERQARAALEAIVHPRIEQLLSEQIAAARMNPAVPAIVLDAALLLEAGWHVLCNAIVYVESPFDQRLERVVRSRGWNSDNLHAREASQWPLEMKRKEADYVVDNSRGAGVALAQLDEVFSKIVPAHPPRNESNLPQ